MPPDLTTALQNATNNPALNKLWLEDVLRLTFSDKGKCFIVLPPEAKPLFDIWQEKYLIPIIKENPWNDDYDGIATIANGYFGIRVKDTPEIRERIIKEMELEDHGVPFFIMHDPKLKKTIKNKKAKHITGPQHAP